MTSIMAASPPEQRQCTVHPRYLTFVPEDDFTLAIYTASSSMCMTHTLLSCYAALSYRVLRATKIGAGLGTRLQSLLGGSLTIATGGRALGLLQGGEEGALVETEHSEGIVIC